MPNSKATGVAYDDPSFGSLNVTGATTLDGNAAIGNGAADLVSFHGASAVDQAAYTATISTTVPVSAAGSPIFGFQTSAQFIAQAAAVNSILACLIEKGLMAAS